MTGRQVRLLLVLGLLLLMINLPMALSLSTERRIASDGVDVVATLVDAEASGSGEDLRHVVSFRLPPEVDPDQAVLGAPVTEEAFLEAERHHADRLERISGTGSDRGICAIDHSKNRSRSQYVRRLGCNQADDRTVSLGALAPAGWRQCGGDRCDK